MLSNVNLEFVTVVGKTTVYPIKGNNRLGFAFYYDLGGIRQPRKVVTGKTEEELETKALKFLKERSDNYIMEKAHEKKCKKIFNKILSQV